LNTLSPNHNCRKEYFVRGKLAGGKRPKRYRDLEKRKSFYHSGCPREPIQWTSLEIWVAIGIFGSWNLSMKTMIAETKLIISQKIEFENWEKSMLIVNRGFLYLSVFHSKVEILTRFLYCFLCLLINKSSFRLWRWKSAKNFREN